MGLRAPWDGQAETVYRVARMQSIWVEFEADLFSWAVDIAQRDFNTLITYATSQLEKSSASKVVVARLIGELAELANYKDDLKVDYLDK